MTGRHRASAGSGPKRANAGIDRKTVYRAIRDGRLPAENWGTEERPRFSVDPASLAALAVRRRQPSVAPRPAAEMVPLARRGTFGRLARGIDSPPSPTGGDAAKRGEGRRTRYVVRWLEGGRHHGRTFRLRVDADAYDREMKRRGQRGAHAPALPSAERVAEWLEAWWRRESPRWAQSTRLSRAGVLDKWVAPYLNGYRLRDVGADRVAE